MNDSNPLINERSTFVVPPHSDYLQINLYDTDPDSGYVGSAVVHSEDIPNFAVLLDLRDFGHNVGQVVVKFTCSFAAKPLGSSYVPDPPIKRWTTRDKTTVENLINQHKRLIKSSQKYTGMNEEIKTDLRSRMAAFPYSNKHPGQKNSERSANVSPHRPILVRTTHGLGEEEETSSVYGPDLNGSTGLFREESSTQNSLYPMKSAFAHRLNRERYALPHYLDTHETESYTVQTGVLEPEEYSHKAARKN